MKNMIIGAIVGGLILFVWQFISWGLADLHYSQMAHTSNQDAIIQVLEQNLDEGSYFIPRAAKGASQEAQQTLMDERGGKPWAVVHYRESLSPSMSLNFTRNLVTDFFAVLLLIWLLQKFEGRDMRTCVTSAIGVGLIGYLSVIYVNTIYFELNSMPDLIDAIVGWGLTGAWLGWWMNR